MDCRFREDCSELGPTRVLADSSSPGTIPDTFVYFLWVFVRQCKIGRTAGFPEDCSDLGPCGLAEPQHDPRYICLFSVGVVAIVQNQQIHSLRRICKDIDLLCSDAAAPTTAPCRCMLSNRLKYGMLQVLARYG